MKYEQPEIEIIRFESGDIVCESLGDDDSGDNNTGWV